MQAMPTHRVYLFSPVATTASRLRVRHIVRVGQVPIRATCPVAVAHAGSPETDCRPGPARRAYHPHQVAPLGWADALSYALGIDVVGMLKFLLTL